MCRPVSWLTGPKLASFLHSNIKSNLQCILLNVYTCICDIMMCKCTLIGNLYIKHRCICHNG